MKFAILGDTHFDFYFNPNGVVTERQFDAKFKTLLEGAPADVLLIPGDIGHYNSQNIQCLRHLRRYYDRVVVTFGNHDYYLITKSIVSKYQWGTGWGDSSVSGGSRERIEEVKFFIDREDGIDYVDGNVVEIDGVRIGGASGWYDGSLLMNAGKSHSDVNMIWRLTMNDANKIYPNGNNLTKFDTLFHEQKHRIEDVYQDCDIMMTHVSPLSEWNQFTEMYNFQPAIAAQIPNYATDHEALQDYRAFYCFDGKHLLENGSMSHWIFGHTHRNFERLYVREGKEDIKILCNSIGYPKGGSQRKTTSDFEIKIIEVTK